MTDHPKVIEGTFDVISEGVAAFTTSPVQAAAPGNADNPIAAAHVALIRELAPLAIPKLHVNTDPEEFENVADYIVRMAAIFDRWLKAVGEDVKSSAICNVNLGMFTRQFQATVEGYATFELDRAAEALREEREEMDADVRQAIRYGRTLGHVMDVLMDNMGLPRALK
jgi:hypothetical protein